MDANQLHISPSSTIPMFRQMAEQIRRFVAAGQLNIGESLPSVRAMAEHHGINPMTVSRAYSLLVAEGLLQHRRGSGMRVAPSPLRASLTAEARMRVLDARMQDLIREAQDLGLAAGPVCERLHALFLAPTPEAEGAQIPNARNSVSSRDRSQRRSNS